MIEYIIAGAGWDTTMETVLAIIITGDHTLKPGVNFVTSEEDQQQVGLLSHPKGHVVEPHRHHKYKREIWYTREVLIIRKGRLRLDLYNEMRELQTSRELRAGDTVILVDGGHGIEILEDCEILEVKTGPYNAAYDKVRFLPKEAPK